MCSPCFVHLSRLCFPDFPFHWHARRFFRFTGWSTWAVKPLFSVTRRFGPTLTTKTRPCPWNLSRYASTIVASAFHRFWCLRASWWNRSAFSDAAPLKIGVGIEGKESGKQYKELIERGRVKTNNLFVINYLDVWVYAWAAKDLTQKVLYLLYINILIYYTII